MGVLLPFADPRSDFLGRNGLVACSRMGAIVTRDPITYDKQKRYVEQSSLDRLAAAGNFLMTLAAGYAIFNKLMHMIFALSDRCTAKQLMHLDAVPRLLPANSPSAPLVRRAIILCQKHALPSNWVLEEPVLSDAAPSLSCCGKYERPYVLPPSRGPMLGLDPASLPSEPRPLDPVLGPAEQVATWMEIFDSSSKKPLHLDPPRIRRAIHALHTWQTTGSLPDPKDCKNVRCFFFEKFDLFRESYDAKPGEERLDRRTARHIRWTTARCHALT